MAGRCYAAGALWHLGYPEQARRHLEAALTRAQELAHPFTLTQVFYHRQVCSHFRQSTFGFCDLGLRLAELFLRRTSTPDSS